MSTWCGCAYKYCTHTLAHNYTCRSPCIHISYFDIVDLSSLATTYYILPAITTITIISFGLWLLLIEAPQVSYCNIALGPKGTPPLFVLFVHPPILIGFVYVRSIMLSFYLLKLSLYIYISIYLSLSFCRPIDSWETLLHFFVIVVVVIIVSFFFFFFFFCVVELERHTSTTLKDTTLTHLNGEM